MTHREFREMQRKMDDAGMMSDILRIRTSKTLISQVHEEGKPEPKPKYRYKYRYEVRLNGKVIKGCKTRATAKKKLVDLYHEKMSALSI